MKLVFVCLYAALIVSVVVLTTSCSLTDEQRGQIIDVVQRIPTPTATPMPTPTPTPIPAPTPKPDLSVGASMRGVEEFAKGEGIPTMDTGGRGIFLDFRGRGDFDEKFALWCSEAKGAAMPAATDAEPRGIYHQCE